MSIGAKLQNSKVAIIVSSDSNAGGQDYKRLENNLRPTSAASRHRKSNSDVMQYNSTTNIST